MLAECFGVLVVQVRVGVRVLLGLGGRVETRIVGLLGLLVTPELVVRKRVGVVVETTVWGDPVEDRETVVLRGLRVGPAVSVVLRVGMRMVIVGAPVVGTRVPIVGAPAVGTRVPVVGVPRTVVAARLDESPPVERTGVIDPVLGVGSGFVGWMLERE